MWMPVRCAENLKQPITDNSSQLSGGAFPATLMARQNVACIRKCPRIPLLERGVTEMSIDGWIVLGPVVRWQQDRK